MLKVFKNDKDDICIQVFGKTFYKDLNVLKRIIPFATFSKEDKAWIVSTTELITVIEQWDQDEVAFSCPYEYLLGQEIIKPDPLEGILIRDFKTNITLANFQKEGASFLEQKKNALLADQMGLGKSLESAAPAFELINSKKANRLVIFCPATVKFQWKSELIDKIGFTNVVVIYGTPAKRKGQWADALKAEVIVLNYEMAEEFQNELLKNPSLQSDIIILDEAHFIKNPSAKRTKIITSFKAKYKWLLTGTPIDNKPEEIYTLMNYIDPTILGTYKSFKKKYICEEFDPMLRCARIYGYKNLNELYQKISPYMLRRLTVDVAPELPDKRETNRFIKITQTQLKLHKEIDNKINEIQDKARKNPDFTVGETSPDDYILGQKQVLLGICDSTELLSLSPSANIRKIAPSKFESPKTKELISLLKEELLDNPQAKIVVFTQFAKMLHLLLRDLKQAGINPVFIDGSVSSSNREKAKQHFTENPSVNVILLTEAGNTGLNLQIAHMLINFDLPYTPGVYEQRNGRILRIGSKHKECIIVNLVLTAEDDQFKTQDEKNLAGLIRKASYSNQIIDGQI